MSPTRFLEQFGHLADAPNGIAKLRELILQLAVRGKLVAQDPNDEPASVLLERIREEKERLVVDGKTKRHNITVRTAKPDRLSPTGWKVCSLNDISVIDMGNSPPGSTYNNTGGGLPLINGPVEFSPGHFGKTKKTKWTTAPTVLCGEGDILVCVRGATTGRTNIADFVACIGRGVARVHAPWIQDYVNLLMWENGNRLLQMGTGTTFPSISFKDLASTAVCLPPLEEQSRIVTKVDQLMAFCDELEAKQNQRAETQVQLIRAAHRPLIQSRGHAELQVAWRRIRDNFDDLHTTVDSVKALRQAILQLAVQGKLVPQDPNDEPASVLLERIREEKERLVEEGKIKGTKALSVVEPGEVPRGWDVSHFSGVASIRSNLVKPDSYPRSPHVAPDNIEKETARLLPYNTVEQDGVTSSKHRFFSGQLLYSKIRPNLSKLVIVDFAGLCSADMYPIDPHIDTDFLKYFMLSNLFLEQVTSEDNRLAMPKVNQGQLNSVTVLVPPLREQRRIASKLDWLMALCDELEAKIEAHETTARQFAEAIVAKLAA